MKQPSQFFSLISSLQLFVYWTGVGLISWAKSSKSHPCYCHSQTQDKSLLVRLVPCR